MRDGGGWKAAVDVEVNVRVLRNRVAPVFFKFVYNTTVSEVSAIGTSVITVAADDSDKNVSVYCWSCCVRAC